MSDPLSTDHERQLLTELVQLVRQRAKGEEEIQTRLANQNVIAAEEQAELATTSQTKYHEERQRLEEEYQRARAEAVARFDAEGATLKKQYADLQRNIPQAAAEALASAKKKQQEIRWEANTVFDATKNQPAQKLAVYKKHVAARAKEIEETLAAARALLAERRQREPGGQGSGVGGQGTGNEASEPAAIGVDLKNPLTPLVQQVEAARLQLAELQQQRLPQMFVGVLPVGVVLLVGGLLAAIIGLAFQSPLGAAIGGVVGLLLGGGICAALFPVAKRQTAAAFAPLAKLAAESGPLQEQIVRTVTAACEREYADLVARRESETQRADELYQQSATKINAEQQQRLAEVESKYQPLASDLQSRRQRELTALDEKHPRQLAALEEQFRVDQDQATAKHRRRQSENHRRRDRDYDALVTQWQDGFAKFLSGADAITAREAALFPPWDQALQGDWQPPQQPPPGVRFGQFELSLAQMKLAMSDDANFRPERTTFPLPALLTFPERCSLLVKAAGEGRDAAVQLLQGVMLRLLTSLPPGKVRFTVVDPVGLGQNFSAFMHLADHDEQLITSRIWTERSHIEQRLADLTEHMETVFQKYLRNEFPTIEAYNRHAGEVAEPYRFLVVANFPAGFTEDSARRLASIASTGARCGVYTLVSVDAQQPLPHRFDLADLERAAEVLVWKDTRFIWRHPDLEKLPLTVESPPPPEEFTRIVRTAGKLAKDAHRVEVPFAYVAPPEADYWTGTCGREFSVALGRAGATKLQAMKLGRGTSQHALIAGKTGSGKSTLLHALITNAALHYSPDEVEFYLIDFKKGVEFKTYASLHLPHARVIAIESEREFGLSVLQRLDAELKRRGELFRDAGVQDIGGFREAVPDTPLPRTLLIIDEFQEFFVEDDKLAQDASLLLDRLVRQGRAFGMHAVLGSQTLGGAYSLARTTLGQMAVRVALQCSEADAHLILSEENTAARLLSRPGEAIYNDANGLVEGNNLFQVVWLSDAQREGYLRKVYDMAQARKCLPPPPIVFEGNMPADPAGNPLLAARLAATTWGETPRATQAWLGAAIAIKDPTAAVLRRQGGANILVVGQRPDLALGMLSIAALSLAAQHAPDGAVKHGAVNGSSGARFFILDGTPPDSPDAGFWRAWGDSLPHRVTVASLREVPKVVAELAAEATRREQESDFEAPPWFVVAFDLGRLRDLRKGDEDFSFSFSETKTVSPSKQFAGVLREGPAVGIHTLAWCDSYTNVQRVLERQGLRDFDHRILFQMSATDSSNLIDSPAATKLGPQRSYLFSEDQGQLEKFRPYGVPSAAWLAEAGRQLAARQSVHDPASPQLAAETATERAMHGGA